MRKITVGFGLRQRGGLLNEIMHSNQIHLPQMDSDCKYRSACENARNSCSTEYSTCPEYLARLNDESIKGIK